MFLKGCCQNDLLYLSWTLNNSPRPQAISAGRGIFPTINKVCLYHIATIIEVAISAGRKIEYFHFMAKFHIFWRSPDFGKALFADVAKRMSLYLFFPTIDIYGR